MINGICILKVINLYINISISDCVSRGNKQTHVEFYFSKQIYFFKNTKLMCSTSNIYRRLSEIFHSPI